MAIFERHPPAAAAGSRAAIRCRATTCATGCPVRPAVVKRDSQRRAGRARRRKSNDHPRIGQRDQRRRARPPAPTAPRTARRARSAATPRSPAPTATATARPLTTRSGAGQRLGWRLCHTAAAKIGSARAKLLKNLPLLNIGCKRRSGFSRVESVISLCNGEAFPLLLRRDAGHGGQSSLASRNEGGPGTSSVSRAGSILVACLMPRRTAPRAGRSARRPIARHP